MNSRLLANQVALITGAAGLGIGTTTAELLAASGATVVLNGLDPKGVERIANQVRSSGAVDTAVADVAKPEAVAKMVEAVLAKHGRVDILINNAAHGAPNQRIDAVANETWDRDIAEILSGSFYCCRAVVPSMIAQRGGRIVFISSSAALRGSWGRGVSYVAAKAGLVGMTKRLALELGEHNVCVNAVAPSQIDTPRVRGGGRRTSESMMHYAEQCVPLGRVGLPADVADVVLFLVSPASRYITGQVINVDGGASLAPKIGRPLVD
ncbi:MAG TPA: SDR family NAD(P)-dependent oxidoreductase [Vicinamibacterales bacterium]|nr:SDR family NAD(P)-dependent oxidoreductase [Vicinamibacterales bacterium]